jgi:hypothetical protein
VAAGDAVGGSLTGASVESSEDATPRRPRPAAATNFKPYQFSGSGRSLGVGSCPYEAASQTFAFVAAL